MNKYLNKVIAHEGMTRSTLHDNVTANMYGPDKSKRTEWVYKCPKCIGVYATPTGIIKHCKENHGETMSRNATEFCKTYRLAQNLIFEKAPSKIIDPEPEIFYGGARGGGNNLSSVAELWRSTAHLDGTVSTVSKPTKENRESGHDEECYSIVVSSEVFNSLKDTDKISEPRPTYIPDAEQLVINTMRSKLISADTKPTKENRESGRIPGSSPPEYG